MTSVILLALLSGCRSDGDNRVFSKVVAAVTGGQQAPVITGSPKTTVAIGEKYAFRPRAHSPENASLKFDIAQPAALVEIRRRHRSARWRAHGRRRRHLRKRDDLRHGRRVDREPAGVRHQGRRGRADARPDPAHDSAARLDARARPVGRQRVRVHRDPGDRVRARLYRDRAHGHLPARHAESVDARRSRQQQRLEAPDPDAARDGVGLR